MSNDMKNYNAYDLTDATMSQGSQPSFVDMAKATREKADHDNRMAVLEYLINHQFERKYLYSRELVQNARDANASRIDFEFSYDEKNKHGIIAVKDNGDGMDMDIIQKYFLKLFSSSKEFDLSKVGRYGIGIVTVFSQDPESVVVYTKMKKQEGYAVFINPPKHGGDAKIFKANEKIDFDHGTRIFIKVNADKYGFDEIKRELREELFTYCGRITPSLFFDGERMNRPFDIDSPYKARFGGRGLEGVIAFTPESSYYELLNGKILIKSGGDLLESEAESQREKFGSDISILIDSVHIKCDLSRSNIDKDSRYKQLLKRAKKEKETLAGQIFKALEEQEYFSLKTYDHSELRPTTEQDRLLRFALDYLQNKIESLNGKVSRRSKLMRVFRKNSISIDELVSSMPSEITSAKIFRTIDGKKASIADVYAHVKANKSIYVSNKLDKITSEIINQGKLVLVKYDVFKAKDEEQPILHRILSTFGSTVEVQQEFSMPATVPYSTLDDERKKFIDNFNRLMRKSPLSRYFFGVKFADFREDDNKPKPLVSGGDFDTEYGYSGSSTTKMHKAYTLEGKNIYSSTVGLGYGKKEILADKIPIVDRARKAFFNRETVILSVSHPYIQKLVSMQNDPEYGQMAYDFLLVTLAAEAAAYKSSVVRKVNEYIAERRQNEPKKKQEELDKSMIKEGRL